MRQRHGNYISLLVLLISLTLALVGCSGLEQSRVTNTDNKELSTIDQFDATRQVMANYLSNELVTMKPDELYQIVQEQNPEYLLVDIRLNKDFVQSNIPGSVNIPYASTSNPEKLAILPKDKTLIFIDYNGHLAAQTAATYNQLGYQSVPLFYGIQSWTKGNAPRGFEPFPAEPLNYPLVAQMENITLADYDLPEILYPPGKIDEYIINTTSIHTDRKYRGIIEAKDMIKVNPGVYFLVDIRSPDHYQQGHIEGSINIPLAQLANKEYIKKLPINKRIVLIGYDGMDASFGSRCLVSLGYDSAALKYGLSHWSANSQMTGVTPIHNLVKEHYQMEPLNYVQPSTTAAGCS